jgi:hypothetical protein
MELLIQKSNHFDEDLELFGPQICGRRNSCQSAQTNRNLNPKIILRKAHEPSSVLQIPFTFKFE